MRHQAFFERLAAIDPSRAGEWESLSAGLVTVRLADRRVDPAAFGPLPKEVAAVRASVHRLPDGPTRWALEAIIDGVVERGPIASRLAIYGGTLEDAGEFRVAIDVYRLAIDAARTEGTGVLPVIPHALDRIGFASRQLGSTDDALVAYELGRAIADEIGDVSAALRIDVSTANVFLWKGEFELASDVLETVVATARRLGLREPLALALHDAGCVCFRRGDYDEALVRFGEALRLQDDQARRLRLLVDLGLCASETGLYDMARDAFEFVFASALAFDVRWTAAINLLDLHGSHADWVAFDHYAALIEPQDLPPRLAMAFHLYAGQGEERRGNVPRAGALLFIASEIAERYGLRELVEREREPAPPRRLDIPDDVAAVADSVRAVRRTVTWW